MKTRNRYIAAHILFWIVYFTLHMMQFSRFEHIENAMWRSLVIIFPQILVAYLNIELLIPALLIKKKYWLYFGTLVVAFILLFNYYRFMPEVFHVMNPAPDFPRFRTPPHPTWSRRFNLSPVRMRATMDIMQAIMIILLSTAYKMVRIAFTREREATLLRSENLNSELRFLKTQINPHFLFNALNNIYTLSLIKSAETPDMILRLSGMLRYVLYDCNEDKVLLEKEIAYISNYIALHKLKDSRITSIEFEHNDADGKVMIAPMVLIPFVENAFKHSKIEDIKNGWIKISLVTKHQTLKFRIENSISEGKFTKDSTGGIGLENVRRRLILLYPDRHELDIEQNNGIFSVNLNILL